MTIGAAGIDLEAEYNNRARVPEHAEIGARWSHLAAKARNDLSPYIELSYGEKPRCAYDLFTAPRRGHSTPLVVYIHGGYWQRGDRKDYSFVARELNALGIDVMVPGYSLCPEVAIADIVAELRGLMATAWQRYGRRPVVVGHSAGGQLAAAMLATDWSKVAGVPDDLVRAAYAVSGVFELEPLIPTSLNAALKLTPQTAKAASPLMWPAPKGRTLVAAVGGEESREFIRQAMAVTAAWSAAGVAAECVIVPCTNHFTIVDELARPGSAMVRRIAGLARESAGLS